MWRWSMLLLVGCSFHQSVKTDAGGDDHPDTPIVFDDGGNQIGWLRADTAADFGEAGAQLDAIAIDPGAAPADATLTSAAYFYGGLVARGTGTCPVADAASLDYAVFSALTPTGIAFVDTIEMPDRHAPAGIQTDPNDGSWGYWLEGEVELPAGMTTFTLVADDIGMFEIAEPGAATFTRVVTGSYLTGPQTAPYTAAAAGWHPFRMAMCQTDGPYTLSLFAADASNPTPAAIPRRKLRSRVESLRGVMVTAWDQRLFGMRASTSLWTDAMLFDQFATSPPGPATTDDVSARWAGETKIATAGDYTAHADTDDGNLVVLGATGIDHFGYNGGQILTDVTATLATGWQPLALEYNNLGGGAHAVLQLDPSGTQPTATIAADHLRPVIPAAMRLATYYDDVSLAIPNDPSNPQIRTWRASGYTAETVSDVWLTYEFTHGMPHELLITLTGPDGTNVVVRPNGSDTPSPVHLQLTSTFTGKPLVGAWKLTVKDTSGGMTGSLDGWSLAVFANGGPPALAPKSVWRSATHDIGAVAIDTIKLAATTPAGSTAAAFVRTCDATPCTTEPWTGPYQNGDVVTAAPKRYAQVGVELTATTEAEPVVDYVELQYRFHP